MAKIYVMVSNKRLVNRRIAMKKQKEKKPWVFTKARKDSLRLAQKEHVRLVRLGESVDTKRHKK